MAKWMLAPLDGPVTEWSAILVYRRESRVKTTVAKGYATPEKGHGSLAEKAETERHLHHSTHEAEI